MEKNKSIIFYLPHLVMRGPGVCMSISKGCCCFCWPANEFERSASTGKTMVQIQTSTTHWPLAWTKTNLYVKVQRTTNLPRRPRITAPWAQPSLCPPAQVCHPCTASCLRPAPAPPSSPSASQTFRATTTSPCTTAFSTPWRPAWWNLDHKK